MKSETLCEDAQYGNLPFDRFILGRWDHSRARAEDQQQWNDLARQWLTLTPGERHPYHELSARRLQPDASLPLSEQYDRVLAPFQTVRERNLSLSVVDSFAFPVWLRTCYLPELAEDYAVISPDNETYPIVKESQVLDDRSIYSTCATDWTHILLRMPALTDSIQYTGDADLANIIIAEDDLEEPVEQYQKKLYDATRAITTMMLLADEEAVREHIIKIMWLDSHGKCVWG